MADLPYIDEHALSIPATREQAWGALTVQLRRQLGGVPAPLTRLMGLTPAELRGDWAGVPGPGDSIPGFEVTDSEPPTRLVLRGEHRFSRYALVFQLDSSRPDECVLRAQSWAAFPGLHGRAYRTLVIGTGAHRLLVNRMLRSVARRV